MSNSLRSIDDIEQEVTNGSQQMVAAPCWSHMLLANLGRTNLEAIITIRNIPNPGGSIQEMANYIYEDNCKVLSSVEKDLFMNVYRTVYGKPYGEESLAKSSGLQASSNESDKADKESSYEVFKEDSPLAGKTFGIGNTAGKGGSLDDLTHKSFDDVKAGEIISGSMSSGDVQKLTEFMANEFQRLRQEYSTVRQEHSTAYSSILDVVGRNKELGDIQYARLRKDLYGISGMLEERVNTSTENFNAQLEELKSATNDNFNAIQACMESQERQNGEVASKLQSQVDGLNLKLSDDCLREPIKKAAQGPQRFDLSPGHNGDQSANIVDNNIRDLDGPYDRHVTLRKRSGSATSVYSSGELNGRNAYVSGCGQGLSRSGNTPKCGLLLQGQESPTFCSNPKTSGGGSTTAGEARRRLVQSNAYNSSSPTLNVGSSRTVPSNLCAPSKERVGLVEDVDEHRERARVSASYDGRPNHSGNLTTAGTYTRNVVFANAHPQFVSHSEEPLGGTFSNGDKTPLLRQPDGNFKRVSISDNDSVNSNSLSQMESVFSESLRNIAPTNAKKAQIRKNMGYRMPRNGYLKSFWLLPPQWQKERPDGLPMTSDDGAISEAHLEFVKHRVTQASEKLVGQIKKLQGGPYQGAGDVRSWHDVEREIVDNLNRSSLVIARIHLLYLTDCVSPNISQKIRRRLGTDSWFDANPVDLLLAMWNTLDELFRSESTPEAQCDHMQNIKKSSSETLPQFMYKLQNLFTSVEIETGQDLVDSTKLTRLRGALPKVDVQFLREKFPTNLTYDQLVTRINEYFSNNMDREVYDRFVKQYKLLNAPDNIDGYVHNDLKTVETDMTSGTQLYPPQASNSPKKGKKVKKGNRNFTTNEAKVELTGSCKRCNANNHTAENCPSENLEALRGRCYIL